jgi:putative tryptophan/tyrosine transport system substrate-binding protein
VRRREFVAVLGGATAWSTMAGAQQRIRQPVIGALGQGRPSAPTTLGFWKAFRQGLREEGFEEDQNVRVQYRFGEDLAGLTRAADELVGLDVGVIAAGGTPAALADCILLVARLAHNQL